MPCRSRRGRCSRAVPAAALDRVTAAAYDDWARALPGAGVHPRAVARGRRRRSAPAHTVSEGQGYGMVIVALMAGHDPAAHERFDGLARYALAHPSSGDERLLGWAQDARCRDVAGRRLGHGRRPRRRLRPPPRRTRSGARAARSTTSAPRGACSRGILAEDVHPAHAPDDARRLDRAGRPRYWLATRPSDWMPGHFPAFAAATGDARWRAVRAAHLRLIRRLARPDRAAARLRAHQRPRAARRAGVPRGPRRRALLLERVPHAVADRHRRGADRRRAVARGGGEAEPLGAAADRRARPGGSARATRSAASRSCGTARWPSPPRSPSRR